MHKGVKALVHPKMKIISLMTHPHVVPSLLSSSDRFSHWAFCPSIENVCTIYCSCPERK